LNMFVRFALRSTKQEDKTPMNFAIVRAVKTVYARF
jgi:hypothetical protein